MVIKNPWRGITPVLDKTSDNEGTFLISNAKTTLRGFPDYQAAERVRKCLKEAFDAGVIAKLLQLHDALNI